MPFTVGTIAIGSDHRAREIVDAISTYLEPLGWSVHKHYGGDAVSVDYPVPAKKVSEEVASGLAECGILICGSGIGMSMAANKVQGVRAALAHDPLAAEMSRRHNNANILCLAADGPLENDYNQIVARWLETDFEGGRHQRRVDMLD